VALKPICPAANADQAATALDGASRVAIGSVRRYDKHIRATRLSVPATMAIEARRPKCALARDSVPVHGSWRRARSQAACSPCAARASIASASGLRMSARTPTQAITPILSRRVNRWRRGLRTMLAARISVAAWYAKRPGRAWEKVRLCYGNRPHGAEQLVGPPHHITPRCLIGRTRLPGSIALVP
jgi:hypothetical protein